VVGLALVVGAIAWLETRGSDEPSAEAEPAARILSAGELGDVAATLGHPVYWAGPMSGTELEVSESAGGDVQVRYLPAGTEAGEGSSEALTVGSYPLPDPAAALRAFAARPGSVTRQGRGYEVVWSRQSPTSAYFVPSGNRIQVEVYDPSPKRALALALSGRVRPAP
jgi:hypothetical protein